ncbi:MAG TPA: T9SS type A sorting domain-containing protein, partial [Flavobacteriales bacterium]|nr:T9SS type A sorting domain-containing protein [Flavobacteriales bacterium]
IWASSDSAFSDTATRTSVVTDTIYGRDYDWNTDGTNAGSGYYLGRHACGQILANAFEIYAPDTVTSISFFVDDKSVVNSFLKVELYEYDPTGSLNSTPPIWLEQSDDYALSSSDIGSWITLKLNSPVPVFPGTGNTAYLAAVKGYAHPMDTTLISSSGSDGVVSFIQDNGCNIGSGGFGYWYSAAKTLMIRMNLGDVSIPSFINNNPIAKSIAIYPNPTSDIVNILFSCIDKQSVNIKVINVLGDKIFSESLSQFVGEYKRQIDLKNYPKAVYFLEIETEKGVMNKKLILQ